MAEDDLAVWMLVDGFAHDQIHGCARRFVGIVNHWLWKVGIDEVGVD